MSIFDDFRDILRHENTKLGVDTVTAESSVKKVLLVDYENVKKVDFPSMDLSEYAILLFLGKTQNKVPIDLVQNTQRLGDRVQWIQINGDGNNALDFHIAYMIGRLSEQNPSAEYIILSKDKGFDPLISYINKQKMKCRRISSIIELSPQREKEVTEDSKIVAVIDNLKKVQSNKRPRRKSSLIKHVRTVFNNTINEDKATDLVEALYMKKMISEVNNQIKYNL